MNSDAATNNSVPFIERVGQKVANRLTLEINKDTMDTLYSGNNFELNDDILSSRNRRLNHTTDTLEEAKADALNSKTYKLEADQTAVFNEVVRLILQKETTQKEERRPMLVLGPAGTGKTRLIFAILDAARSMDKDFICTSFNAITATAIGGDTFSGDFFWRPEAHQHHTSSFSKEEITKFLRNHGFGTTFPADTFNDRIVGIVLEEISTFSPEMIHRMDMCLRQITGIDKPFGGLIILMLGDFGQLGPVEATSIPTAVVDFCQYASSEDKNKYVSKEITRLKNKMKNQKNNSNNYPSKSRKAKSKFSATSATHEFKFRCNEGHPYKKGIDLLTSAKLFRLTSQKRAQDKIHRKHIQSMFDGEKLTFQMFEHYKMLNAIDIQKEGSFCEAPILCSTNRERHTINGIMAPIRASGKGVCVIRWPADLKPYWEQKPADEYIDNILLSDPCFWEYFVPGTDGYITDNLSKTLNLVNGTHIRYHSLSFQKNEQKLEFLKLVAETQVGKVLTLPSRLQPETVNVELINLSEKERDEWQRSKLSLDANKVIIPLPCKRKFSKTPKSIIVPADTSGQYKCSKVFVKNFFPVEPGFAITIYKAQGRTIPKVILAISKREGHGCGLNYRSIYVAFSRVKDRNDIRLLLIDHDRSSLQYLTKLKADPCNLAFVEGFDEKGGKYNLNKVLQKYAQLTRNP